MRRPFLAALALASVAVLLSGISGCGGKDDSPAPGPRGAPAPASAHPSDPPPPPRTERERAAYWLDRIVKGPEPSEGEGFEIPNFHTDLLADAIRNLESLPGPTLDLLSDRALLQHVTVSKETMHWYGILNLLGQIGVKRPEVARMWALPGLTVDETPLRRLALGVLASLQDPADAPVLLATLTGNSSDRILGPTALAALMAIGPPWDARAARAVFERGGAALWVEFTGAVIGARRSREATADTLAWWSLLAEASGPLATSGTDVQGHEVASSDPAKGPVVGPEHWMTSSGRTVTSAREVLAGMSFAPFVAALRADLDSADEARVRAAMQVLVHAADPEARKRARARAEKALASFAPPAVNDGLPSGAELQFLIAVLRGDDSPEATALLRRIFLEARPAATYRDVCMAAFEALADRHASPTDVLRAALAGQDPVEASLAATALRKGRDPENVGFVRELLKAEGPGPKRHELRSLLLWLSAAAIEKGGMAPESVASLAREVSGWVAEGGGEEGFATALMDLGPPGEALFAEGLRGPNRSTYVPALLEAGKIVSVPVIEALLERIDYETPDADRRTALIAAFRTAPQRAVGALTALERRLRPAARAEAETILKIVRNRAPGP